MIIYMAMGAIGFTVILCWLKLALRQNPTIWEIVIPGAYVIYVFAAAARRIDKALKKIESM